MFCYYNDVQSLANWTPTYFRQPTISAVDMPAKL